MISVRPLLGFKPETWCSDHPTTPPHPPKWTPSTPPHINKQEEKTPTEATSRPHASPRDEYRRKKIPKPVNKQDTETRREEGSGPPCCPQHLREGTARTCWKIVFSFSAEFLKSSGDTNVRKKAARFCHMFAEEGESVDELQHAVVVVVFFFFVVVVFVVFFFFFFGWWVEDYWSPVEKANRRAVGGATRRCSSQSAFTTPVGAHTKYGFPSKARAHL